MSNEDRNLTEKIPHSGEPVVTEFNKPLVQAYEEGLLKTPETSRDIPQTAEKKKGKKGLIGAGVGLAGLALGGSLFLGLGNNANGGEQAPEPNQPVPTDVAETDPSGPEAPIESPSDAREYIIPLEELANMSPEQLTDASTISVESVSVNGEVDWSLYAERYNDIRKLVTNAGTSFGELDKVYNEVGATQDVIQEKYNDPMLLGLFGEDSLRLTDTGLRGYHNNVIIAAFNQYLANEPITVESNYEVTSVEVTDESDSIAQLIVTTRFQDNFFSSGAFDSENPNITENLGRSADLDITATEKLTLKIFNGNIYVYDVENL